MNREDIQKRLEEIRNTPLQSLEEVDVLALLQERKSLEEELRQEEERVRQAEEEAQRLAEEKARAESAAKQQILVDELKEKIKVLSASIHPDQNDEELIRIITERKELEAALQALLQESGEINKAEEKPLSEKAAEEVTPEPRASEEPVSPISEEVPQESLQQVEEPVLQDEKITIDTGLQHQEAHVGKSGKASPIEHADDRVILDTSLDSGEYQGYIAELKANSNSLGTFLQGLPAGAKKNRSFMLEVAKIDPAYAMHYADKETLKKDESFNVRIAGMNNMRNTGNPLSEMLPEMRTSAVVLAAVKNDFRNVRFILPNMADYDEILALAKKGALESLHTLKNAHDIEFFIPPVLQKDKKFMEEVKKVVSTQN